MTPTQEVCNALSMLLATFVFAQQTVQHWPNGPLTILLLGSVMHLPTSVAYHMLSSCRRLLQRLDQSMIHLSGAFFAFALSGGSWFFVGIYLCHGVFAISRIWKKKRERRWVQVAFSVLLWMWPMVGHMQFVVAAVAFYGGGLCSIPEVNKRYLGGWGHTLFHLGVAMTAWSMCRFCCAKPTHAHA